MYLLAYKVYVAVMFSFLRVAMSKDACRAKLGFQQASNPATPMQWGPVSGVRPGTPATGHLQVRRSH